MNKKILTSSLIFTMMMMVGASPTAIADSGREWLKSAPAFCRSEPYSNLTPKQMSMCDEAAFRYLSKHWQTITAANGQAYEIALDTVTRNLPANVAPRASLRAATVVVYISEGDTFNPDNVLHFYFDCHDRFQTSSRSLWSPTAYAPPLSIAAKISTVACTHTILPNNQTKSPSITNDEIEHTYWGAVAQRVRSFWMLPETIKWDTDLLVQVVITLNKNGEILNVQFDQRSRDPQFDQIVMEAIKKASPMPRFPELMPQETTQIGLKFRPGVLGN